VDFIKYGKPAFIGSWIVVLLGLGVVLYKGNAIYGVDFAGGDVVTASFTTRIDSGKIRESPIKPEWAKSAPPTPAPWAAARSNSKLETAYEKIRRALRRAAEGLPERGLKLEGTSQVGPTIGKEIELERAQIDRGLHVRRS